MFKELAWALCVCVSFIGWGVSLARLFRLPRDIGSAGCLGVSLAVCYGGVVDLLGIASQLTTVGFVAVGAIVGVAQIGALERDAFSALMPKALTARLMLAAIVLFAVVGVAGHIYYADYDVYDDYLAYLVYPQKLLQTGLLGFEPFSERRLLTSLGGLYFLQALVLVGSGFFYLHTIDPALGLALALLLLLDAMARRRVALSWRFGVLLFALLLMPTILNLTAILLPLALVLFVYLLLEADPDVEAGPRCAGRIVAIALVASALIAIKTAYLPWIGFFLAFVYGRRIILDRFAWRSWLEPTLLAVLTLLFLLPWMLGSLRDVGTALFPALGRGFHASRYGIYPTPWELAPASDYLGVLLRTGAIIMLQVLLAWFIFALVARDTRATIALEVGLLSASVVLVLAVAIGTGLEVHYPRYAYPGVAAALLVVAYRFATVASRSPGAGPSRMRIAAVVGACVVASAAGYHGVVQYYGHAVTNLGMAVLGPGFRPAMLAYIVSHEEGVVPQAILRMQRAVPAGATVLERLDYPFLMDFRRNNVFIADYPAATSLPPGMPAFQGPEKLAAYLLGVSIRYVAYAYADQARFPDWEKSLYNTGDRWIDFETKLAFDFQHNLAALMQTRRLVYKDDERVVIDLAETQ
jgi:hypothetical protein